MKKAFQELGETREEVIVRFKKEKRDLEGHVERLKALRHRKNLDEGGEKKWEAGKSFTKVRMKKPI